ncbi:hypothetical protein [Gemmobacter sp.]|uniref:hypothetical protein n=1 Tax=Gemmobacter sp. TaxID=1898957 RepID=UPI002AFF56C1|nr:hypothetical protein [Gemmobacter sp.]
MLGEWQDINQQVARTRIIGLPGSRMMLSLLGSTGTGGANSTTMEMWNGSSSLPVTMPSDITKGIRRGLAAWSPTGRQAAISGQTAVSAAPLVSSGLVTAFFLGMGQATGGGQSTAACSASATGRAA